LLKIFEVSKRFFNLQPMSSCGYLYISKLGMLYIAPDLLNVSISVVKTFYWNI
jgi:hypothetical protein